MLNYRNLIEQTFYWPTEEFDLQTNGLRFQGIDLMQLIRAYGTPLRLTYLPKIGQQIEKARRLFRQNMERLAYPGKYYYAYCTKASHFSFILKETLKHQVQLETSSAYDLYIIRELYSLGWISKDTYILCNGYKRQLYKDLIIELLNEGFHNLIPILDHTTELDDYEARVTGPFQVGLRVAADEEPNFGFYTSRLGIRYNEVLSFYESRLENHPQISLRMLHFFINTGIRDTTYYWGELSQFLDKYVQLRQICPSLTALDIGGGLPAKMRLGFEYDYNYMIGQIIENILLACQEGQVPCPDIFSEFGSFTVAESGALLYSVLDHKQQNDKELWYMIDGSFITNLPDSWALNQKYIMLAVNNWESRLQKVHLGGLTCDSMDYYDSEAHGGEIYLPRLPKNATQFIGFFHVGAYQEALSGYGGVQHCLLPAPRHIIIDRCEDGSLRTEEFFQEQTPQGMLQALGYSAEVAAPIT